MPGNGGMRPDHSSRSVPVLTPLHSMSTTTSSSPGRVSARRLSSRSPVPSAPPRSCPSPCSVFVLAGIRCPCSMSRYLDILICQYKLTVSVKAFGRGAGRQAPASRGSRWSATGFRREAIVPRQSRPAQQHFATRQSYAGGRCPSPAGRRRNRPSPIGSAPDVPDSGSASSSVPLSGKAARAPAGSPAPRHRRDRASPEPATRCRPRRAAGR